MNSNTPNVLNLNQNIFANPGFETSPEYNVSQHSGTALYEDDIIPFHPDQATTMSSSIGPSSPSMSNNVPYPQMPFIINSSNIHGVGVHNNNNGTNKASSRHEYSNLMKPFSLRNRSTFAPPPPPINPMRASNDTHRNILSNPSNFLRGSGGNNTNAPMVYPLAHSPVSQVTLSFILHC